MPRFRPAKLENLLIIAVFSAALYVPLILGILEENRIISNSEKRKFAARPPVPGSFNACMDYPEAFNDYYADHFGLRDRLTGKYYRLYNKLLGPPLKADVTAGQEDWFFLGNIIPGYDRCGDPFGDYRNINRYSEQELAEYADFIVSVNNWLTARGIKYLFFIAPNKHTVYADKLPHYITKQHHESAMDQVLNYLNRHTNVQTVDLRPSLLNARQNHPVYYKTDTHWNSHGANAAQFTIMEKVSIMMPGHDIIPFRLAEERFRKTGGYRGDLMHLAKNSHLTEDQWIPDFEVATTPLTETLNKKSAGPYIVECGEKHLSALIFRDSFFTALEPHISRYFGRSAYVWERMNFESLKKYVEREKPDIVIDEIVERILPCAPPFAQETPADQQ